MAKGRYDDNVGGERRPKRGRTMTTLAITVLGMIMILLTMGSFVSVELHLRRLSSGSNSSGGGSETAKKKNHRNNVLFDEFTSPKTQTTILHHSMAQNSNQAIQAKTTRGTSESTRVDPRPVLQTSPSRPHRKWAYAFLVGSCNPEKPGYRGFLYNVLLAARRLRSLGSVADVVLMIQMSTHTRETRLPQLEEQLLTSQGIQLRYIPKFSSETHEVFYTLQMEKFRILALTEYSRVFFLDSDIFPKVNLDYIFELSEPQSKTTTPAVLRGNLLVAWKLEPCNGGFFMMAPQEGDFEDFQAIIQRRNQEVLTMEYPYWNSTLGWGHVFDPEKDRWIPPKNLPEKFGPNHTIEWSWHGAFGDQGLIYYWSKYFKRDVSIVIEHRVQQWGDCNGEACLKEDSIPILKGNKKLALLGVVHHFTGKTKPWVHDPNVKSEGKEIWFAELDKLEAELKANDAQASNSVVVGLSLRAQVDRLVLQQQDGKATTLGHYPSYRQMYLHVQALAAEGWNPYMNASTDIFLPMVEQ